MNCLKQYFLLEMKKTYLQLPKLLAGSLLLFAITLLCIFSLHTFTADADKRKPVFIGVLAEKEEPFIDWIINTANQMPDMGYSFQIERIDKKTAENDFFSEESNVLFIVPKNYIASIIRGENTPLTIRFSKEQTSIINTLMKELADAASSYILDSEGAIYSMQDYYKKYQLPDEGNDELSLNITYVQEIIHFTDAIKPASENTTTDVPLLTSSLSAGIILLPLLFGLILTPVMLSEGPSLKEQLMRLGISAWQQILIKEIVFFLSIFSIFFCIAFSVLCLQQIHPFLSGTLCSDAFGICCLLFGCSPVLLFSAAFSILIYEIAGDTSGGMLLLFFSTVFMALFSGLFYPIRYLPAFFRKTAVFLPTSHAHNFILQLFQQKFRGHDFLFLIFCSICFYLITVLISDFRMKGR